MELLGASLTIGALLSFNLLSRNTRAPTGVTKFGAAFPDPKCAHPRMDESPAGRFAPPDRKDATTDGQAHHCRVHRGLAPAVPERGGPLQAAHGGRGGRAREADRARRPGGEGADDQLQPAPRGLDRQALPGSRPATRRPDPGGRDRPQPRGREVRLAARLQVLDLRHLVDPPGLPARGREPVDDDPHSRARARAPGQAGRARHAPGEARPRRRPSRSWPRQTACRSGTPRRRSRPSRRTVSLNQEVGSDGDGELGDLFATERRSTRPTRPTTRCAPTRCASAVAALPDRQRRILELRFGFQGEPQSLESIGKELGLTRERVRQLESESLYRLESILADQLADAA